MQFHQQFILNKAIEHQITGFYSRPDFLCISKVPLKSVTACCLLLFSIFKQNDLRPVAEVVIWQYSWSYYATMQSFFLFSNIKLEPAAVHLSFPCCTKLLFTPSHQLLFFSPLLSRTSPILQRTHTHSAAVGIFITPSLQAQQLRP